VFTDGHRLRFPKYRAYHKIWGWVKRNAPTATSRGREGAFVIAGKMICKYPRTSGRLWFVTIVTLLGPKTQSPGPRRPQGLAHDSVVYLTTPLRRVRDNGFNGSKEFLEGGVL